MIFRGEPAACLDERKLLSRRLTDFCNHGTNQKMVYKLDRVNLGRIGIK
jgi:hypothetical protein